jgi:diguanylate cyclase (GGDEF)-like protein
MMPHSLAPPPDQNADDDATAASTLFGTGETVDVFNLAPIAMLCFDYSGIKKLLDSWQLADAAALRHMMETEAWRPAATMAETRILNVNQRALALYEAPSLAALQSGVGAIFQAETIAAHIDEVTGLWGGQKTITFPSVDFTLTGRRFEARVNTTVLPGYEQDWGHIIVSVEDVSAEFASQTRLAESEAYAMALFQRAPVGLWVEDFSGVKILLDGLKAQGVTDFLQYSNHDLAFVPRCVSTIRVLDMNQAALDLYEASSKAEMLARFTEIFPEGEENNLAAEFASLWAGKLSFSRDFAQLTLSGKPLHVRSQFSVLPGHEHDWSLVLVAQTDFTARKQIEERLEYLTGHDILTGLHNRMAYVAEQERLVAAGKFPISVIIADLNGLKVVNDAQGHEAGDALLRRAGAVLRDATAGGGMVARIGGDEFAILLPNATDLVSQTVAGRIERLTAASNQATEGPALSFAVGSSLCNSAAELEEAVKQADMRMYRAKRAHYERLS